ncbi:hypothetical protein [Aquimarina sp. MMG016]|uniref:hypothetical protein n=1 Tax=Aquimarina sp. MMG016 TaxID=2822690 RepID=UPI001B39E764|nr:hypothetical protein [Aquimarina sp. MMG016]MBQ4819887.1 hypothetical protein [Aquimarina sp. MMG016]
MKKKLEAELISIAHRILQLKDKSTLPQLQEEARKLYEKLTILSFAESQSLGPQPTIGQITAALDEEAEPIEIKKEVIKPILSLEEQPDEIVQPAETIIDLEEKDIHTKEEDIPEIIIEEINAKVTEDLFVPAVKATEETISLSEPVFEKNDMENVGQSMPIIDTLNDQDEKPKSLNDQLKKGINIGLNDRLAFIKHLFDGSAADYNRVLSQLNTLNSKGGARQFILNMVKPDYNNWKGKEEYEQRFIDIVMNKFEF